MSAGDHSPVIAMRWYRRAWLWVAAGIVLFLVALGVAVLAADDAETVGSSPVVMVALALFALPVLAFLVAGLVTQRPRARGALLSFAAVFFFLGVYWVWVYNGYLESEALDGCLPILTPEGDEGLLDPELCEATTDGALQSWQRTTWLVFALFWVAPVVTLLVVRNKIRQGDTAPANTPLVMMGAGWALLAVGAYMAVGAILDDGLLGRALLWWVVPGVLGVLLIATGRSKHSDQKTQPPQT